MPLLLVAVLVRLAERARLVEVDLGHRHDVGRGELRVGHVVGGDAPAPGEGDDLVPLGRTVLRDLERAVADARDRRDEAAALVDHLRELLDRGLRGRRNRHDGGPCCRARLRRGGRRVRAERTAGPRRRKRAERRRWPMRPRSPEPRTSSRFTSFSRAALRWPRGSPAPRPRRDRRRQSAPAPAPGEASRASKPSEGSSAGAGDPLLDLANERLYRDDVPLLREDLRDASADRRGELAVGLVGRDLERGAGPS